MVPEPGQARPGSSPIELEPSCTSRPKRQRPHTSSLQTTTLPSIVQTIESPCHHCPPPTACSCIDSGAYLTLVSCFLCLTLSRLSCAPPLPSNIHGTADVAAELVSARSVSSSNPSCRHSSITCLFSSLRSNPGSLFPVGPETQNQYRPQCPARRPTITATSPSRLGATATST